MIASVGFVVFWWRVGLWLVPCVGFRLGRLDGFVGGRVVVRGWIWVFLWVSVVGVVCWCGQVRVWFWVGCAIWSSSSPMTF